MVYYYNELQRQQQYGVQLPVTHFHPTFEISVHQNYQADKKYVYKTVKSATVSIKHYIVSTEKSGYLNQGPIY